MTDKQKLEIMTELVNGNLGGARELCERYTSYRSILLMSMRIQYANFKSDVLKGRAEDVFSQTLEIYAKTEISSFFEDTELDDETYKTLARVNESSCEHLLDRLYDYFIGNEYASVNTYADIEDWVGWFCEEEERGFND